jgi:hypothetical protein
VSPEQAADGRAPGWHRHLELVATILLAVATVTTAWSAFQSSKWGGFSTASYSAASADRTLSSRSATLAGQQTIIDVTLFTDWLGAVNEEQGQVLPPDYVPDPTTYSGFLYARFRPEFRPALHAWLAEDPATNSDAPPSPFAMDEYVLAAAQESHRLEASADESAAQARVANQRKDNYVLATVMCASVFFFAGIGAKLGSSRRRASMIVLAAVVLLATVAVLASFPVRV